MRACDYGLLGQTVPDLISELYTFAEVNGSAEARRLLVDVLYAAVFLSKDLGYGDLAWMVSGHLHATTVALGEPVLGGVARFVRSHATVGVRARERALTIAQRSAELLEPDDGPAGQVYGMLHLSAALQSAVTGRADSARAHLTEAAETASRTGDGSFTGLNFGPATSGCGGSPLQLSSASPAGSSSWPAASRWPRSTRRGARPPSTVIWAAGWPPSVVGRCKRSRRCAALRSSHHSESDVLTGLTGNTPTQWSGRGRGAR
jgi:hypothetical protein